MNEGNKDREDRVLILDFGSQYTQLIARRVRELNVYCEIQPYNASSETIQEFDPIGVILSGGPETVTKIDSPSPDPLIYKLGKPVLGICYGMQTMAAHLGGAVETSRKREYGLARVAVQQDEPLISWHDEGNPSSFGELDVWMSHGDKVTELPPGFKIIASSKNAPLAGIADVNRRLFGLQFHPEVTHTPRGSQIIERFLKAICGATGSWTASYIVSELITTIKSKVKNEIVLLGLSGGVDSTITAALLNRAIDKQLTCIFVDNGLLRYGEVEEVLTNFRDQFGNGIRYVDASDRFLTALTDVDDPEHKRKIIGRIFIEVFEEEASKIDGAAWLAQGTIYPDVIESGGIRGAAADVIKSHHNVGGLPDLLNLKLLEPLSKLFKDEVRQIGAELGVPTAVLKRHPFPGPGLAVRIVGQVNQANIDLLREVDAIYISALQEWGLYDEVSQAFAVFLPIKSVGVVGDARAYDHVVALRAVETTDFMTARWKKLPYDFLETVSTRIINEVRGISRVVYDISDKPPATIEWE